MDRIPVGTLCLVIGPLPRHPDFIGRSVEVVGHVPPGHRLLQTDGAIRSAVDDYYVEASWLPSRWVTNRKNLYPISPDDTIRQEPKEKLKDLPEVET